MKGIWLGGPIAILLNKNNAENYFQHFKFQYIQNKRENDVTFTQILTVNDYICREPMLGYENDQGGSTFTI